MIEIDFDDLTVDQIGVYENRIEVFGVDSTIKLDRRLFDKDIFETDSKEKIKDILNDKYTIRDCDIDER